MTDLSKESWYHGRVSRVDAEKILESQGSVEGSFLVRDSLTMTGEYVLSLCHQVCGGGGGRGERRKGGREEGRKKDKGRREGRIEGLSVRRGREENLSLVCEWRKKRVVGIVCRMLCAVVGKHPIIYENIEVNLKGKKQSHGDLYLTWCPYLNVIGYRNMGGIA